MTTRRVERAINSCITRRWSEFGSASTVWSVVTPGGPAVDPEFVLHADDVHVSDVEEVRGALVGRQVLLFDLEPNDVGIVVSALDVVDRDGDALASRVFRCDAREQIGRERGDAALARQVIAQKGDAANLRRCF
jgi:hypothetical protein